MREVVEEPLNVGVEHVTCLGDGVPAASRSPYAYRWPETVGIPMKWTLRGGVVFSLSHESYGLMGLMR